MPRLFTGLEIPENIRQHLSLLKTGLLGSRWISPENYHITLRFVGDIENRLANELADSLENVDFETFPLRVTGLGSFGGNKPRSIWAQIEADDELFSLQRHHEHIARQTGLPPETRNFIPHITLARLKGTSSLDVAKFIENFGDYTSEWFNVESFVLFSSKSQKGGGPYKIEARYTNNSYFYNDE